MSLVGHIITIITNDSAKVDGDSNNTTYTGNADNTGYTINVVNLDTDTWTTSYVLPSFGPHSVPAVPAAPVTQNWNANFAAINVLIQRELEDQKQDLVSAINGQLSPGVLSAIEANISYLTGLGILGETPGQAWNQTAQGTPEPNTL